MDELPMTGRAPLDHTGGIALWRQIVHAIEQDVIDGTLAPRARLPTEAELSVHFGVNRHTVRRALEELSRAGMVQVEQGRGSFVAEDVLDYAISARTRFSEWIRTHNKEPGGHMLDLRELAAGAPVVRMQRLGLADGRPVSLADHHFPAARSGRDLEAVNKTVSGLTKLLFPDPDMPVPDTDLEWIVRVALRLAAPVAEIGDVQTCCSHPSRPRPDGPQR
jgi:DNA-binding GntR family transcriptional regulator